MGVQKRLRNGKVRWVARYRDPGGKEHSKTFDREKDGKLWLADQQVKLASGTWIDPATATLTVGQLYDEWVGSKLRSTSSRQMYAYTRDKLLTPIEHLPAPSLSAVQVQEWYGSLLNCRTWIGSGDGGVAPGTAMGAMRHLNAAFHYGIDAGLVLRNPVRMPRQEAAIERADIPTGSEIDELVDTLRDGGAKYMERDGDEMVVRTMKPNPLVADIVLTGRLTGMRANEVLGLAPDDVDLDARVIRVSRQLSRDGKRVPLKTPSSRRVVPITDGLAQVLARHMARGHSTVFASVNGNPILYSRLSTLISRARQGNERLHFHALRHFFASQLLTQGLPVQDVAALLGHSSPTVTLRVYAHVMEDSVDRARDAITAALSCGTDAGRRHLRAVGD